MTGFESDPSKIIFEVPALNALECDLIWQYCLTEIIKLNWCSWIHTKAWCFINRKIEHRDKNITKMHWKWGEDNRLKDRERLGTDSLCSKLSEESKPTETFICVYLDSRTMRQWVYIFQAIQLMVFCKGPCKLIDWIYTFHRFLYDLFSCYLLGLTTERNLDQKYWPTLIPHEEPMTKLPVHPGLPTIIRLCIT